MKRKSITDSDHRRSKTRPGQSKDILDIPTPWVIRPSVIKPPFKTDTLEDLLDIAWNYKGSAIFGESDLFDWETLWLLIPVLTELKNMVAMTSLKEAIVNFILYHIHKRQKREEMLHTVLRGPPGSGKTEVAKIIAKIYRGLGFLSTSNVIVAKRSDFIAQYTGQSEEKTKEILEKARGGVLFIDEAYSLGGTDDRIDNFSKVVVNMLNQQLSQHTDFVCIIAGYQDQLDKCFFSVNPGLKSRFPWSFEIIGYSGTEMLQIFLRKVKKEGWNIAKDAISDDFFTRHSSNFEAFGRDIDNFFLKCKIAHTKRVFGSTLPEIITKEDINLAFKKYYVKKTADIPSYFS